MNFILNPYSYLLLSSILSFTTFLFYSEGSLKIIYLSIPIFILFIISYPFGKSIIQKNSTYYLNKELILSSIYWKVVAFFIVCFAIIEYLSFGFPLYKGVIYANFGFPIIHHLVVTSWILIFIKFKNKKINLFLLIFAFLNPILIVNRDLFLLTIFALLCKKIFENKINIKLFVILLSVMFILFGLIGQLRSGNALQLINLPFTFDSNEINPILFWIILYMTSSTFNMSYNINNFSTNLYDSLINVFPEQYKWYLMSGEVTYFLYYILIFIILTFLLIISKNKNYIPIYIYFLYQSLMGVTFGTKFFTTNSLMLILVFLIYFLLPKKISS